MRELLRQPDFLRLWLVGAFANAMRWLELLASGLFAYEVTGSALAVTAVVAARQLPQLLFGAFAGAVSEAVEPQADRHAGADGAGHRLDRAGDARHHRASRAVARGAGQPGRRARCGRPRCRPGGAWWARSRGRTASCTAIALDSATNAATRMIGPLLGGIAFEWLGMKGAYTLTALVQFFGAFAMAGLVHPQMTRRLDLARIPAEIAEGLRLRPHQAHHPAGVRHHHRHQRLRLRLFRPGGAARASAPSTSRPALVGLLAAAEPIGALLGGALIAAGLLRMDRRLAFAGGAALFMVALIVMALSPSYWLAFAVLVHRRLRHGGLRQHADHPDADRGAAPRCARA